MSSCAVSALLSRRLHSLLWPVLRPHAPLLDDAIRQAVSLYLPVLLCSATMAAHLQVTAAHSG